MARSRPFKIHKGAGGLLGAARAIDRQGSGAGNESVFDFLKRSPDTGKSVRVITPESVAVPDARDGTAPTTSESSLVFGVDGLVTGPVAGGAAGVTEAVIEGSGQVTGPVFAAVGMATQSFIGALPSVA